MCNAYVNYVTGKYHDAVVVFDVYRSGPTKDTAHLCRTKGITGAKVYFTQNTPDTAHLCRTKGITGAKVYFTQNTPFKTKKEQFLSNYENKQEFIFMLGRCLLANGCSTIHAEGDSDVLIVATAVKCAENREVALIGEYTDLLVLLCYHANLENNRIYFKSEPMQRLTSKGIGVLGKKKTKVLLGPDACRLLPFIHALTGCDTKSRVY